MKCSKIAFIYQKHDTLRYVTFLYKNPDTSQKARQFALHFYIKKSRHFALRDLSLNFWNWRRGVDIFHAKKNNAFCVIFNTQKIIHFAICYIYKKPDTIRYIFICKKKCTLRYVYIYITYCIVMIPNYNRTYDQSDHIEK